MWSGGLDPTYRAALNSGHTMVSRVDVTDNLGVVLIPDLPISQGQVQATLQSRVTRTLSASTDRSYMPLTRGGEVDFTAPLAPVGNRIRAYRGIRYGNGSTWPPPYGFPVFYGAIESVALSRTGELKVTANDLANEIVTAQFEQPMNSIPVNSVATEFKRLVLDAMPAATFGVGDNIHLAVGQLTWATDRAKALDDISGGSSGLWYPLADGSFIQRYNPWTKPGQMPGLYIVDGASGVSPTVSLASQDWTVTISRTGVTNSVVYISDRQDGSPPLRAVARDTTPGSPTYVRGKFGKKVSIITNQGALTQGQVNVAAVTELHKALALGVMWQPLNVVPDGSIELGDVVGVDVDGMITTQVVTGFTLPLKHDGVMALNVRAYTPTS